MPCFVGRKRCLRTRVWAGPYRKDDSRVFLIVPGDARRLRPPLCSSSLPYATCADLAGDVSMAQTNPVSSRAMAAVILEGCLLL